MLSKFQLFLLSAKKTIIGKYFSLFDICNSNTALAKNFDNRPSADIIKRATALIINVLLPIREHFGLPMIVSCIFRCLLLNRFLGSKDDSQHVKGEACDFTIPGKTIDEIFNWIKHNLVFDQLIHEGTWIHVSFSLVKNRKQCLKLVNGKYIPA